MIILVVREWLPIKYISWLTNSVVLFSRFPPTFLPNCLSTFYLLAPRHIFITLSQYIFDDNKVWFLAPYFFGNTRTDIKNDQLIWLFQLILYHFLNHAFGSGSSSSQGSKYFDHTKLADKNPHQFDICFDFYSLLNFIFLFLQCPSEIKFRIIICGTRREIFPGKIDLKTKEQKFWW